MNFAGYASVFGRRALIGGLFYEQVDPGAFRRALRERQDTYLLLGHDPGRVLARTTAGTLRLSTDRYGLAVRADLPDTGDGRDVATLVGRGDLSLMSFGFREVEDRWEAGSGGVPLRTLVDVDLYDVSVVAFPAYEGTEAKMLSDADAQAERMRGQRSRHALLGLRIVADELWAAMSADERIDAEMAAMRRRRGRLRTLR